MFGAKDAWRFRVGWRDSQCEDTLSMWVGPLEDPGQPWRMDIDSSRWLTWGYSMHKYRKVGKNGWRVKNGYFRNMRDEKDLTRRKSNRWLETWGWDFTVLELWAWESFMKRWKLKYWELMAMMWEQRKECGLRVDCILENGGRRGAFKSDREWGQKDGSTRQMQRFKAM